MPPAVLELCDRLRASAADVDARGIWPSEQIRWCADAGVFRWFIPQQYGGWGWSERELLEGYLALSQSCLTTTFILTQWNAALRRILSSQAIENPSKAAWLSQLLRDMAEGKQFATVGISHLSTSRQHVLPVLEAQAFDQADPSAGYLLNGYSPWVTSAAAADVLVVGATLADGEQLLCLVRGDDLGVSAGSGQQLVALSASCTDQVHFKDVAVPREHVLAGPIANVMKSGGGGGTGGLQTSTLAVGLAMAAVNFISRQAQQRNELQLIYEKLQGDAMELHRALHELTEGQTSSMDASELRRRANSLVLRATQAALTAAKGAGFVASHPTGRMAREALFFLVWSCPQPVAAANLCELAQLS